MKNLPKVFGLITAAGAFLLKQGILVQYDGIITLITTISGAAFAFITKASYVTGGTVAQTDEAKNRTTNVAP